MMEELKSCCLQCHIIIFSFGVIILTIFGFFAFCDYDLFINLKMSGEGRDRSLNTASCYWAAAAAHCVFAIGLIYVKYKDKMCSKKQSFIPQEKVENVLQLKTMSEEIIEADDNQQSKSINKDEDNIIHFD